MPSLEGVWRLLSLSHQNDPIGTSDTHLVVEPEWMWDVDPTRHCYADEPGPEHRYRLEWPADGDGRLEVVSGGNRPNQCAIVRVEGDQLSVRWNGLAGKFPEAFADDYGRIAVYVRESGEVAERLRARPHRRTRTKLVHAVLGALSYDNNLSWWRAQKVPFGGAEVTIYVTAEADVTVDSFDAVAAWMERIDTEPLKVFAASQLLDLHNDSWRQEEGLLGAAEFAARLTPNTICFSSAEQASVDFNDGGLFWGHSVTVDVDVAGTPLGALMQ